MDILSEGDPGKMEYLICMTVIMSVPPLGLRKKRELLSGKPLTLSEVCISLCVYVAQLSFIRVCSIP